MRTPSSLLVLLAVAVAAGCRDAAPVADAPSAPAAAAAPATTIPPVPAAELNPATDRNALLAGARALMLADRNAALVTVDDDGQPRVRTVRAFVDPPDAEQPARGVTVWIMTRPSTRKVDQIRRHPLVTLYFNDDEGVSYATIMGVATVHTDPNHPAAQRHYDEGFVKFFWPDFPKDFVMIEVRPRWIEYLGPDVPNDPQHWRPQAVDLSE